MIRVGPAGYPPGSRDIVHAIEKVKAMGLGAMEVEFVHNVQMSDEKARAAKSKMEELEILLSVHAPYYISLNSSSEETVIKSRDWIMRSARTAQLMGAWIIVLHCASYSGGNSERTTAAVVQQISQCREALDMERNHVVMGLETMGKKGQWGTLAEIQSVMKEVSGVQPVLDFAHIHARDQGRIKGKEDFQAVLDEHDIMPVKRMHCHFSGIAFGKFGEKNHLPLDSGSPDYGPLVHLLSERKGDATLICETIDPSNDAMRMKAMLDLATRMRR
jgi:deoxyribonuclease-4